jgi:hypothetical protein
MRRGSVGRMARFGSFLGNYVIAANKSTQQNWYRRRNMFVL